MDAVTGIVASATVAVKPYADMALAYVPEETPYYTVLLLTLIGAVSVITGLLPMVWACCTHRSQNLKKRYNSEWAFVTGKLSSPFGPKDSLAPAPPNRWWLRPLCPRCICAPTLTVNAFFSVSAHLQAPRPASACR